MYGNNTGALPTSYSMSREEQINEDIHIYNAMQQACVDLLRALDTP